MQVVGHIVALSVRTGLILAPEREERLLVRRVLEGGILLVDRRWHICLLRDQRLLLEEPAEEHGIRTNQVTPIEHFHIVVVIVKLRIYRSRTTGVVVALVGHAGLAVVRFTVGGTARARLVDCPYGKERRIGRDVEVGTGLLQVCGFIRGLRDQTLLRETPAKEHGLGANHRAGIFYSYRRTAVIAVVIYRGIATGLVVTVVGEALLQIVGDTIRGSVRAGLVFAPYGEECRVLSNGKVLAFRLQIAGQIAGLLDQLFLRKAPADECCTRTNEATGIFHLNLRIGVVEVVVRRSRTGSTVTVVGDSVLQVVRHIVAVAIGTFLIDGPCGVKRRVGLDGELVVLLLQVGRLIALSGDDALLLRKAPTDKRGIRALEVAQALYGHFGIIHIGTLLIRRHRATVTAVSVVGHVKRSVTAVYHDCLVTQRGLACAVITDYGVFTSILTGNRPLFLRCTRDRIAIQIPLITCRAIASLQRHRLCRRADEAIARNLELLGIDYRDLGRQCHGLVV